MGFFKKLKKGINKAVNPIEHMKMIRKNVKKHGGKVVKIVKKVGGFILESSVFLPLMPFKGSMKKMIKNRGVNPKKSFPDLLTQFASVVMKKKSYDYTPMYEYDRVNDVYNIAPAILALIPMVIKFFTSLKKKKQRGEPLTKEESQVVDFVDEAVVDLKGAAVEEVDKSSGKFLRENATKIVGGFVGLILLIILYKHFSKAK